MQITNEILFGFIHCPYKAYRKSKSENGEFSDFEKLFIELKSTQKLLFSENISSEKKLIKIQRVEDNIAFTNGVIIDQKFFNANVEIILDGIEFVGRNKIIPILISPFEKVSNSDKLFLSFQASYLQSEFHFQIEHCKIIYGKKLTQKKFILAPFFKAIKKNNIELNKILAQSNHPVFYRNTHCQICEFQNSCLEKLKERDDLSLLVGLRPKEILSKNNRGIFTVKQLSYTFRPIRNPYRKRKFLPELKALALRESKTFIQETPNIQTSQNEVFLDIEGIPDRNFYYLIGVIIKTNDLETHYSYWANNKDEEEKIFIEFFTLLRSLTEFTIYHYGSYEIQALKTISKTLTSDYQKFSKKIIDSSYNILNIFTSNIYPPTYSNSLKDIARFLKFEWTEKNSSGLQSIVWRFNWEITQNDELKHKLIQYNIEDCKALSKVKEWVANIEIQVRNEQSVDFAKTIDIKNDSYYKWGNTKFELPVFNQINNFSHFDYQQKKIFLKSNKNVKKAISKKQSNLINKFDKLIDLYPQKCPSCNQSSNHFDLIRKSEQLVIDIKFTKNGIKKWIVQYSGGGYRCCSCKAIFRPKKLMSGPHSHYGYNIVLWTMNQYIQYNVSLKKISEMIRDLFNMHIPASSMTTFKPFLAEKYKETYNEIKSQIVTGNLIHIDETKANIKDMPSGYVWVFTNMDSVFYLFKQNREVDFLKEFLNNFNGVLVSDFYSGYDNIPCPQQKCLIHIIRDLNNDLLKNQLNIDFKNIVYNFGELLRKIINTVNKYGLKKRNMNKHYKDVDSFYSNFIDKHYDNDLVLSYQKRFQKNKDKLFTFLKYDGIPWNNNNAEHAIKPFAHYRRNNEKQITESGINDYLILLSIQQTCKYRGISFFEFLKSGEMSIFKFSKKIR
jgi:predicted RecB family nuclease